MEANKQNISNTVIPCDLSDVWRANDWPHNDAIRMILWKHTLNVSDLSFGKSQKSCERPPPNYASTKCNISVIITLKPKKSAINSSQRKTTISSHPQNAFHYRNQCHHYLYLPPPLSSPGLGAAAGGCPTQTLPQGCSDPPESPEVREEDPEHGRGQLLPPRPRCHQGLCAPAAEASPVQVQGVLL